MATSQHKDAGLLKNLNMIFLSGLRSRPIVGTGCGMLILFSRLATYVILETIHNICGNEVVTAECASVCQA